MERSTIFHGKIHYNVHFPLLFLVHQRVTQKKIWCLLGRPKSQGPPNQLPATTGTPIAFTVPAAWSALDSAAMGSWADGWFHPKTTRNNAQSIQAYGYSLSMSIQYHARSLMKRFSKRKTKFKGLGLNRLHESCPWLWISAYFCWKLLGDLILSYTLLWTNIAIENGHL